MTDGHGDREAEGPNDSVGQGAQQFSLHLIGTLLKESLKEEFEDNRALNRYF